MFILPKGAKKGIKGPIDFIKVQYEGLNAVCSKCGSEDIDMQIYRTDHPHNNDTGVFHRYIVTSKCRNCRGKKVTTITDIAAGASNVQITHQLNQVIKHM